MSAFGVPVSNLRPYVVDDQPTPQRQLVESVSISKLRSSAAPASTATCVIDAPLTDDTRFVTPRRAVADSPSKALQQTPKSSRRVFGPDEGQSAIIAPRINRPSRDTTATLMNAEALSALILYAKNESPPLDSPAALRAAYMQYTVANPGT